MRPLSRRLSAVMLVVGAFVCNWKIFLAHSDYSFFTSNDAAQHWYPWYQYLGRWMAHLTVPLWDEALQSGRPFLGEMRPGVLYPLNLILALLTSTKHGLPLFAMDLLVVFSVALASCFEYRLARYLGLSRFAAVVSGLTYGYAGFVAENSTWQIAILNGIIWMPLLVLVFLKARHARDTRACCFFVVSSGIVLGLMILAGHVEPPVHAALFLALLALYPWQGQRRFFLRSLGRTTLLLSAAVATAALFAAPQLIAALEYGRHSLRWLGWDSLPPVDAMAGIPYAWGGHFERGHIQDVFTAVNPGLWAGSDYFGVVPVILAVTAFLLGREKAARVFKIGIVFGILLWLGETSIFHGLLYQLVPVLDKVRQPSRAIFPIHLCLATLAGFGAHVLAGPIPRLQKRRLYDFCVLLLWTGGITAGLIVIAGLLAILFKVSTMTDESLEWTLRFALLVLTAVTLIYMRQSGIIRLRVFRSVLLLLLAFDLFSVFSYSILSRQGYNNRNNFFPTVHYAPNEAVRFLTSRAASDLFRVEVLDGALPMNSGMVHSFQEITGFTATGLKEYHAFRAIDWGPRSIVQRLLNRRYLVSNSELDGFRRVVSGSPGVYEDPDALGRVQWVPRARLVPDSAALTAALQDPAFDPRATLLVTAEFRELVPAALVVTDPVELQKAAGETGSAMITNYGPNRITISSKAGPDGFVLLSEIYYPGWRARVDGSPVPIMRADGILRALHVPGGEHRIELYYWPGYFTAGILLSVAVCVMFGVFAVLSRKPRGSDLH